MCAVRFGISIPRFLLAKSVGRLTEPALPGPEWVPLGLPSCGSCGSDLAARLTYRPPLEPLTHR